MNIFLRELKASWKSLVVWSVIVGLLIMIATSKFAAFADDPEMLKILDSMPPAMLDAMSMRAFNLTTLSGFYGLMFIYFGLMAAMAAAMWGSNIISKEERDKTVEFSLVLPVSRKHRWPSVPRTGTRLHRCAVGQHHRRQRGSRR